MTRGGVRRSCSRPTRRLTCLVPSPFRKNPRDTWRVTHAPSPAREPRGRAQGTAGSSYRDAPRYLYHHRRSLNERLTSSGRSGAPTARSRQPVTPSAHPPRAPRTKRTLPGRPPRTARPPPRTRTSRGTSARRCGAPRRRPRRRLRGP